MGLVFKAAADFSTPTKSPPDGHYMVPGTSILGSRRDFSRRPLPADLTRQKLAFSSIPAPAILAGTIHATRIEAGPASQQSSYPD
jgi:hypothetical protein